MSADTDELKVLISQSLESKGVLGKIKAQLRASVVTAINEYEGLHNGNVYLENVGAKRIRDQFEAQIGLGLVCEFLEFYGFQYALSVLLPEANMAERQGLPGPDQMSQYLRLPPSGKPQPLLVDLVSSIKPSSLPSSSSHPSSSSPHSSYPPSSPRSEAPASPRSPRAQPTHWPNKSAPSSAPSSATNSPVIKKLSIPSLNVPAPSSATSSPILSATPAKSQPPQPHPQPQINHSIPQPQSLPQPQPQPQKPQTSSLPSSSLKEEGKKNDPKNKEAAYLSYPEGDDDIDEEIDEDLYDLDGDLDFEDDDEDIEIDAAKKPEDKGKGDIGKSTPKAPLASLSKPAAPLSTSALKKEPQTTKKDAFELDSDGDSDPGSLEEDMKRLSVIEQKLNLFANQPGSKPSPLASLGKPGALSSKPKSPPDDDDLESIGSDYSNYSDDALTADQSMSDRSVNYDHEEDIDI